MDVLRRIRVQRDVGEKEVFIAIRYSSVFHRVSSERHFLHVRLHALCVVPNSRTPHAATNANIAQHTLCCFRIVLREALSEFIRLIWDWYPALGLGGGSRRRAHLGSST
jgi:hypothetical protein